jgi:uncharacterized protein (TIGR02246 family)
MQKRITLAFVLVCLLGLMLEASPARAQGGDKAAVQVVYKQFNDAFDKKDVKGIMALYAPNCFVFDIVPPRQYVGWDAYKKDWDDTLAAFPGPVNTTVSDLEITVVGTVAYTHYIVDGTMTDKDGKASHLVVRSTDVLRKTGGKWLIVEEHNSFPVDLSNGQADLLSKP